MVTHVVIILLHGNHPRDVVKGHSTKAEVCVVWDPVHLLDETIKVGGRNSINSGNEVSRCKAVVVSG